MHENTKPTTGWGARIIGFLKRLSIWHKVIAVVIVVFVLYIVYSIPGDKSELRVREERAKTAEIAFDLANPAVAPMMERVVAYLNNTEIDMTGNRSFTSLGTALSTVNRANSTTASKYRSVITFSRGVHSLMDGDNAVPELDTPEFQSLVGEMDIIFTTAYNALFELNLQVDEFNSYHNKVSLLVAGIFYDLPGKFEDPIPSRNSLDSEALDLDQ